MFVKLLCRTDDSSKKFVEFSSSTPSMTGWFSSYLQHVCHTKFTPRTHLREMRTTKWKALFKLDRKKMVVNLRKRTETQRNSRLVTYKWWRRRRRATTMSTTRYDWKKRQWVFVFVRPSVAFSRLSHSRLKESAFFSLHHCFLLTTFWHCVTMEKQHTNCTHQEKQEHCKKDKRWEEKKREKISESCAENLVSYRNGRKCDNVQGE